MASRSLLRYACFGEHTGAVHAKALDGEARQLTAVDAGGTAPRIRIGTSFQGCD